LALSKDRGEKRASRTGVPIDHSKWGTGVVVSAALIFLSVAAAWWLDRRNDVRTGAMKALAAVQVALAALAFALVVLAGHSGVTAVAGPIIQRTTPGTFPVG
jgi:hypothetical protein